jgi:hypothetical protein
MVAPRRAHPGLVKIRLCELRGAAIVDEGGKTLGHFADFLCRGTAARATADGVVWGTVGLLERFGFRDVAEQTLEWRSVVGVERERIVVRAPRARTRSKR